MGEREKEREKTRGSVEKKVGFFEKKYDAYYYNLLLLFNFFFFDKLLLFNLYTIIIVYLIYILYDYFGYYTISAAFGRLVDEFE